MATDLRISVPLARLPSTAIHWHLLLCGRPDATAVQHLTREAAPSALQTSAGKRSRGWVWRRRRTTLSDPTATSATAPPERTWTASSATSRTGSHTHTASSLSNAAHLPTIANTPITEHRPGQQPRPAITDEASALALLSLPI